MSETGKERKTELFKNCLHSETEAVLEMCAKLTNLEKQWENLFQGQNEAIGRQTAVTKCIIEKDGIIIKIAGTNNAVITGLKFKEKLFKTVIEKFLGAEIKKVEFCTGSVRRVSSAKEAPRAFERYVPLIVTDEQVEKETQLLVEFTKDKQLATLIGKTKAMAEKKRKRKQ